MLIENKVKRILKAGGAVIGCQVAEVRSPNIAQMYATAGFDFMFIDMEHGPFTLETVEDFITASRAAGIVPLIRTPGADEGSIARPLDMGACGLIVPHVGTREQVERIVRFAKYRPVGERGLAPIRAHSSFARMEVGRLIEQANENTMIVIMVEDDAAIGRIDELLSAGEVDVAFLGTMDLSLALGIPGEVRHPEILARIDRMIQACDKRGVAFGMPVSDPKWLRKGIRFLFASSDISLIVDGGARVVKEFQEVMAR